MFTNAGSMINIVKAPYLARVSAVGVRTIVLSMNSPAKSASFHNSAKTRRHTSASCQRANRLQVLFQAPNPSGRLRARANPSWLSTARPQQTTGCPLPSGPGRPICPATPVQYVPTGHHAIFFLPFANPFNQLA